MDVRELLLRRTLPVIINAFNVRTYVENAINKFSSYGFENIIVIDNGSTYPRLLDYYQQLSISNAGKVIVLYYNKNRKHLTNTVLTPRTKPCNQNQTAMDLILSATTQGRSSPTRLIG